MLQWFSCLLWNKIQTLGKSGPSWLPALLSISFSSFSLLPDAQWHPLYLVPPAPAVPHFGSHYMVQPAVRPSFPGLFLLSHGWALSYTLSWSVCQSLALYCLSWVSLPLRPGPSLWDPSSGPDTEETTALLKRIIRIFTFGVFNCWILFPEHLVFI